MTFERFDARFTTTEGAVNLGSPDQRGTIVQVLRARLGGCTFERGLYRVHTESSAAAAVELVDAAFPEFAGRFECFGFDWLGRQFAADSGRGEAGDPEVMMLEPGTGQALEIPSPMSKFHDGEMIDYTDAVLADGFYAEWQAVHPAPLGFEQCAGYRVPLYLGGEDEVTNLELSDISVYWTLMGQLRQKAIGLQPGQSISGIELDCGGRLRR